MVVDVPNFILGTEQLQCECLNFHARNRTQLSGARRRVSRNKSPTNHIPSLISDPVQSIVQRYYVNDSSTDVVSATFELPVPPYGVSIDSTTLAVPFKAIRMKWIKLWVNYRPEKGILGNTANITIIDRRTARPLEWTCTAEYNLTAYSKASFKPSDPIGFWYNTSSGESNPEIRVQLTKGSVMDICFDYIVDDRETNSGTSTGSSLSHPRVYFNKISSDLELAGKTNTTVIVM